MKLLQLFGLNAKLSALGRRYFWTASLVTGLALVIGLLEGLGVSLLIPLLSTFSGSFTATNTRGPLALITHLADGHDRNTRLLIVTSVILTFVLLKGVLQAVANSFASWVDGRMGNDIRCALSKTLQHASYSFYLTQDPARLMNVLGTESWKASDAVRVLLTHLAAIAGVIVMSTLLLLVSWKLSVIVLAGGLLARFVQKKGEARLRELSKQTVSTNQILAERMLFTIFGARVIRLFNYQEEEHLRFEVASDAVRRAILRSERLSGTQGPSLEAMHGALVLVVLLIAVFTGVSLPVLAAFLVLMNRLQPHLRSLEGSAATFAAAAAHFSEVEWLLEQADRPDVATGDESFGGLRESIRFEDVTFAYSDRSEAVANVSFTLRAGRSTALMGSSGAGKSTVINLLCRLLEPSSGRITVDGQQLSNVKRSEWLRAISVAGQDIDLVDGTVAENISYGRPEMEEARIKQAARLAAAGFIEDLPQGFSTLVGARGMSLSGGERQRIGLARALAREPELLILDEATNAIDHATETAIMANLRSLPLTLIIISHKPSMLTYCDDAIVLDHGRVVEVGPMERVHPQRPDPDMLTEEDPSVSMLPS